MRLGCRRDQRVGSVAYPRDASIAEPLRHGVGLYAWFAVHDWEGVQIRIRPDGSVDERASSHNGFNQSAGPVGGWASDLGVDAIKDAEEAIGLRPVNGWGPETRLLIVSGGSHAGHTDGAEGFERFTPGSSVHLVPLEPIAATTTARFSISPPWRKRAWRDPEAEHTD